MRRHTFVWRALATTSIAGAVVGLGAAPAFAHDCFNPTKDAHAPTGGVNYTITGFDTNGNPIVEQTGPGKGYGGFLALAPSVTGAPGTLYVHTLGSGNNPQGVVGGPGSQTPDHACNGTGIDYLGACYSSGG